MRRFIQVALTSLIALGAGCLQQVVHERDLPSDAAVLPSDAGADFCTSPAASFPGAAQTGWRHAQASLTPYTGSLVLSAAVELVGVDIAGCITIRSEGVIVRRSRIRATGCSAPAVVTVEASGAPAGAGVLLEDVEIDGLGSAIDGVAAFSKVTLRRVDLHDVSGRGLVQVSSGIRIEGSYLHEVRGGPAISNSGYGGLSLCQSTLQCPDCSATLTFFAEYGPVTDMLIAFNLIDGGTEYAVYAGGDPAGPYPVSKNVVFRGNRWARTFFPLGGKFGPVAYFDPAGEGNLWIDNAFLAPDEQILP